MSNYYIPKSDTDKRHSITIKREPNKYTYIIGFIFICVIGCLILIAGFHYSRKNAYTNAKELYNSQSYAEAKSSFEELGDYQDCVDWVIKCDEKIIETKYNNAVSLYEERKYQDSLLLFREISDYADTSAYITKCELGVIKASTGRSKVEFGRFGKNEEPINWIVLEKNNESALMISTYYLTSKIANNKDEGARQEYSCWSNSTLRRWLNYQFIKEAFYAEEEECLLENEISTDEYDTINYDGWSASKITVQTTDKVYIPSSNDVEHYAINPTSSVSNQNNNIEGWLRDRGHGIAFQRTLKANGEFGSEWHFYSSFGVRPMIRVKFSDKKKKNTNSVSNEEKSQVKEQVKSKYPDDAFEWNGHHYYLYDNSSSWDNAEIYCEKIGGHLATITSEEENNAVYGFLRSKGYENAYFGFSDQSAEGTFLWITNEEVEYTNWASGEPNSENSSEDYAMFYYKYSEGQWNDGDFGGTTVNGGVMYICEWD